MKRNDAEAIFNDIFNTLSEKQRDIGDLVEGYMSNTSKTNTKPSIDMLNYNGTVTIMVDLPGIARDDIKIDITEKFLEITADYGDESELDENIFIRKERYHGVLNRKISLPPELSITETSAKFEDGVLAISIPKIVNDENVEVEVN